MKACRRYGPSATRETGTVTEFRLLSVSRIPDDTNLKTLAELGVMEVTARTIIQVFE
jgi:hypothetical protein